MLNRTTLMLLLLTSITLLPVASAAGAAEFENGEAMTAIERVTYISFVAISLMFIATAFFLFMERTTLPSEAPNLTMKEVEDSANMQMASR